MPFTKTVVTASHPAETLRNRTTLTYIPTDSTTPLKIGKIIIRIESPKDASHSNIRKFSLLSLDICPFNFDNFKAIFKRRMSINDEELAEYGSFLDQSTSSVFTTGTTYYNMDTQEGLQTLLSAIKEFEPRIPEQILQDIATSFEMQHPSLLDRCMQKAIECEAAAGTGHRSQIPGHLARLLQQRAEKRAELFVARP